MSCNKVRIFFLCSKRLDHLFRGRIERFLERERELMEQLDEWEEKETDEESYNESLPILEFVSATLLIMLTSWV